MRPQRTYLFAGYLLLAVALLSAAALMDGCKKKGRNDAYELTGDTLTDGKNLVQINCTRCHALVPPGALIKDVWRVHTLPAMAHYLGVTPYLDGYYKRETDTTGLSLTEWQAIVNYYNKLAPNALLAAKPPVPLADDWAGFSLKMPAPEANVSFTTMVAYNKYNHKLYTSENVKDQLTAWDSNLKGKFAAKLPSTAVNALFKKGDDDKDHAILSCIGKIEPVDFPDGAVVNVNLSAKLDTAKQPVIADDLPRPSQTLEGDFNKDGLTDLVVLGQGNYKGGVILYLQNKDHSYSQTIISKRPGAVQAIAGDFNKDGYTDLMILFGFGDEGLALFTNDHKGGFTTKNLLRFPPVYGSTSFQLADLDHDGNPDLIYTCGYNFRDSRILKPYHGLYIYKNTGNFNFKQEWFYPINGCSKAIAADFNGDGNTGIATCAFFADMQHNPGESFIYFEHDNAFTFKPHAVPVSKYGRWMTMDVADVNSDGKPDIILGNYASGFLFQPGFVPNWAKNIPFIVLENHFKK